MWAIYDFADTIFSMNVVSLYFPLVVVSELGGKDIYVSAANSASQLAVVFLAPFLGAISDRSGKRMPFFVASAALTAAATAAITPFSRVKALVGVLLAFFVANVTYQLSLTFYNSLLPRVCPPQRWGKISGLGTALGYVGSIFGMAVVMPFNTGTLLGVDVPFLRGGGRTATFIPTAALFAAFAAPTLIFFAVDEAKRPYPADSSRGNPLRKVLEALRDAERFPGVGRFLLARLLFQEGVETAIIFMGVFADKAMGMPDSAKIPFFMVSTTAAVFGSLVWGRVTDSIGPHRALMLVLGGWVLGLAALVASPSLTVFWFVGAWLGAMLGGVWTASRPYILSLSPPETVGRIFGLYSLTGKAAAVLGPLVWGAVVLATEGLGTRTSYRIAVSALALIIAAGAAILHKNGEVFRKLSSAQPAQARR